MKKINIIATIACLFLACGLFAQYQIERQVVASAGGFGTTATHQVSWTLGDVATASYLDGSFRITQGFQQSEDLVSDVANEFQLVNFKFYPNPTKGGASLELNMPFRANLQFRVIDTTGRAVLENKAAAPEGLFIQQFELNDLPSGSYFLQITDEEKKLLTTVKFVRS